MTTKFTLTKKNTVVESAKIYAHKSGKSISKLVEDYLKSLSDQGSEQADFDPKVRKLLGTVKLPKDFDYKKELVNAISEKYNK